MPSIAPDQHASIVHVAVAVLLNDRDEVLISLRPGDVHQGGLWEFPGGKLEMGESPEQALQREIREELGLVVERALPFIRIHHAYPDKTVILNVWRVHDFKGEPQGKEGQRIRWCRIDQLKPADFPRANRAIIRALQLPDQFMITGSASDLDQFMRKVEQALLQGVRLIQLRFNQDETYIELAGRVKNLCGQAGARLLLNTNPSIFEQVEADGLHLNSKRLFDYDSRPISDDKILSASCHDERELRQANRLGADIVLLSPVKPTSSHPGAAVLGWSGFMQLAAISCCPVYALGGMSLSDMREAKQHGAQGIAAISCFWSHEK